MSPVHLLRDWRTWTRLFIYLGFWTTWLYLDEWVLPQGLTAASNDLIFFLILLLAVTLPLVLYLALPPLGAVPHLAEMIIFNAILFLVPLALPYHSMRAILPIVLVTLFVIPLSILGFLISFWLNRRLGRFRREG